MTESKQIVFFRLRLIEAIKSKMKSEKLTQVQLGQKLEMNQSSVSRILNYSPTPLEVLIEVAIKMNIQVTLEIN